MGEAEAEMAVTRATARMMQALLGPGGVQDQAEAAVRQALAADPGDTAVLWKLGEIHRRQGNLAAAHDVYRRLAALGPDRRKASWLSASLGGGRLPETVVPRGVWPAPFVRMTSFLTSEQCDRLMALAYAERGRLLSARVGLGKGSRVDPEARITFEADAQVRRDVGPWFLPKLRSAVPEVLARLRMEGDDQYDVQYWNMRVYAAGGFYSAHHDAVANRKLSFVYFFHPEPRRFSGGDLLLYDADAETAHCPLEAFSRIVPLRNSIVFFPSRSWHQVTPVTCDPDDFGSGRFVLNGHFRSRLPTAKPEG